MTTDTVDSAEASKLVKEMVTAYGELDHDLMHSEKRMRAAARVLLERMRKFNKENMGVVRGTKDDLLYYSNRGRAGHLDDLAGMQAPNHLGPEDIDAFARKHGLSAEDET